MTLRKLLTCIEKKALNPAVACNIASKWCYRRTPYLFIFGTCYQASIQYNNKVAEIRVYSMFEERGYLKLDKRVWTGQLSRKKWREQALIAAGHTKEEIVAVEVAARLRGEL